MLGLADMISDGNRWRRDAHRQISTIIRSPYFTGFQENGNGRRNENSAENGVASGIFWGCCYETRQGAVELVESAWGSFFLMAALCILVDIIEPNHC
jgi:unsaturated chondroitin disaccharide hydrolase